VLPDESIGFLLLIFAFKMYLLVCTSDCIFIAEQVQNTSFLLSIILYHFDQETRFMH